MAENKKTNDEELFINRELSWLEFNRRVLDLSKRKNVPLGEQLSFAAIYGSNLDEFFMIRVGSLYDQTLLNSKETENKTGMTAQEQLEAIMPKVKELQQGCDKDVYKLYEALQGHGLYRVDFENLSREQESFWKKYFLQEFYPVLSPQIIGRRHPFPFLRNRELYVGTMLRNPKGEKTLFGLIPLSSHYERVLFMPDGENLQFALVEELILHFAHLVFGKNVVESRCLFRVTRNADLDVQEGMFDHDIDYRVVMSELLKRRRKLAAVRLQFWGKPSAAIKAYLCEKLLLPQEQCFAQKAPLELSYLYKLRDRLKKKNDPSLFYPAVRPIHPPSGFRLYEAVRRQDYLLCYPYQSFKPFIQMLQDAANDPQVLSIKMTLYRVADDSKIIEALIAAAENGKEVVTVVELRARFDEQNNIDWSRQLEQAGCTVIYGFNDYKVHSKLLLITKCSENGFEYVVQVGTGNYNEKTSELYTDLSYITTNRALAEEAAGVFNNLAVERLTEEVDSLIVAPLCFKRVLLKELKEEIKYQKKGGKGKVIVKCNSISDKNIIETLSEASNIGVNVQMIVRGICCLQAGLPGLSENIKVRSIVGRYLEHSRIYLFGEGERLRVYIASGDFLTRNTERRVEVGVRVKDPAIQKMLCDILDMQLADNVNARQMQPDGSYAWIRSNKNAPLVDSQMEMYPYLAAMLPQQVVRSSGLRVAEKQKPEQTVKNEEMKRKPRAMPRRIGSRRLNGRRRRML